MALPEAESHAAISYLQISYLFPHAIPSLEPHHHSLPAQYAPTHEVNSGSNEVAPAENTSLGEDRLEDLFPMETDQLVPEQPEVSSPTAPTWQHQAPAVREKASLATIWVCSLRQLDLTSDV